MEGDASPSGQAERSLLVMQLSRESSLLQSVGLQTGRRLFRVSPKLIPEEPLLTLPAAFPPVRWLVVVTTGSSHDGGCDCVGVSLPAGNEPPPLWWVSSELSADGIGLCYH